MMTKSNFLRSATLAFVLVAATGAMHAAAFAGRTDAAQQQHQAQWQSNQPVQQGATAAPYDGPDFTIPFNDVY